MKPLPGPKLMFPQGIENYMHKGLNQSEHTHAHNTHCTFSL